MPVPFVIVAPEPLPRLDAWRVLQAAAVVGFFAAWLFVVAHAGLILAAEWRLAAMLREANQFARLPQVSSQELTQVVAGQVEAAGWGRPRVLIMPTEGEHAGYQVAAIEVSATRVLPSWLRSVTPSLTRPLRAIGDLPVPYAGAPDWGFERGK